MNLHHYAIASTVEGARQVIPQGPVAALEIIKNLGTNGGGFFNANGAHPYENPTPLTNLIEMLAIVLLPAALTNTFGRMIGQPRQGWLFYCVMVFLFCSGLIFVDHFEQKGNPHLVGVDFRTGSLQSGGNMEGKEVRFGIAGSTPVVTSAPAPPTTGQGLPALAERLRRLRDQAEQLARELETLKKKRGRNRFESRSHGLCFLGGPRPARHMQPLGRLINRENGLKGVRALVLRAELSFSICFPWHLARL